MLSEEDELSFFFDKSAYLSLSQKGEGLYAATQNK